jgi:hypothetical protein
VRLAKGEPSLEEHFTKGTLVEKAVRLLRRKSVEITDESLHGAIMNQSSDGSSGSSSGSREFNMKSSIVDGKEKKVYLSSAENVFVYVIIWKLLFPEMSSSDDFSNLKILDGAGGYGSRLMAAIMLNANYVGVEPNPLSTPGFNKMIEMFGSSEKQKMLEDGLPNAAGVNAMPPGWADVVMFSPPMWGKEVYNDETVAKQSINMFSNEKMWLDQFLHASIEELWSHLRVGGFIVFQSVRYDYIGEYMIKEHAEKRKDAVFRGILSRVTTAGRYKPNWVWQKINPDVIEIEGEGEEGKERNVETVVKEQEGRSEQESKSEESKSEESKSEESRSEESKSEESKSEESKSEESKSEEGKLPKKKVIFVKKKTLKKMPTPTPE